MITANLLIYTLILIAGINLFTPFASREASREASAALRNFLLLFTSTCFLINVLIANWFFLTGLSMHVVMCSFGNYFLAFHLEPIGLIFLNLVAFLWICSIMYTIKYLLVNDIQHPNNFLFFLNLAVFCGILVALSANLFTMFVFYEILTLVTIPLITHQKNTAVDGAIDKALFKYLSVLMISSLALLLPAIIIIYGKIGHGNFTCLGFIGNNFLRKHTIVLLLMFIFGISKTALYPLHSWLPAAMIASYPVSALLHAVIVVKVGLVCLYKVLVYVFGLCYLHSLFATGNWLIFLPILTIIYSSLKAISTNNIKIILAYSTINQLSIALVSAFMFTKKAQVAALLQLLAHAVSKICLFYTAGNYYTVKGTYLTNELSKIAQEMPKTSAMLLISALSLIGIPPFAGFISKLYIMFAAAEQGQILVMLTLVISTMCSAIYLGNMLFLIYQLKQPGGQPLKQHLRHLRQLVLPHNITLSNKKCGRKLPALMLIPTYLFAVVIVLFIVVNMLISRFMFYL